MRRRSGRRTSDRIQHVFVQAVRRIDIGTAETHLVAHPEALHQRYRRRVDLCGKRIDHIEPENAEAVLETRGRGLEKSMKPMNEYAGIDEVDRVEAVAVPLEIAFESSYQFRGLRRIHSSRKKRMTIGSALRRAKVPVSTAVQRLNPRRLEVKRYRAVSEPIAMSVSNRAALRHLIKKMLTTAGPCD